MGHNRKTSRPTQSARLLALLLRGAEVALPEILDLRISQYGTRLKELRDRGFVITNRKERRNGKTYSWFRLLVQSLPTEDAATPQPADSLFPDMERRHVDLG